MVQYSQIRGKVSSFNKRFLSDSDAVGTKVDVNVASKNFTLHADRKANGKTSGNLKLSDNFKIGGKLYDLSTVVKTGDVQELSVGTAVTDELRVRLGAVSKKPVINNEGKVTDNAGVSLGFSYNTAKCGMSTDVKYIHQRHTELEVSGACLYKDFTFGGKTKLNVQEQDFNAALKNLELGARGDFGKYATYVVLSDEFNGVKGGVECQVDGTADTVFAESEYTINKENSVKLAVGLQKSLASGASAAVRLTNDFQIGAAYTATVNRNLIATVAANVDTNTNKSKIGLDLKFTF
uniref:Voltage-dependent anion-selective channel protein n=1 Tax=Percolomonas cosmopolitus TaxID=63605 RepID=A0A7S1PH91_9EUKA|eukprot:CAMPEP_0117446260 /NCGR_PEP_ID=MMETSP0759-20121206/6239_1 /TAXON_ID=63605 /ORGANISM="Percolomonas cosmopolitus, Strain WS" /LENGTH=292 /DNA_ID=CAMNT_0005238501 /DNA_START=75 /DNA_END=953 /DNA_ORIENTATION=-